MRILDIIEKPTSRLFHYMHDIVESYAYENNDEFRAIEDARNRHGGNVMALGDSDDPDGDLLTVDTYFRQNRIVYEVKPWLQWFWNIQHWARQPSHWWWEFKAAKSRVVKGYDNSAVWNFCTWHSETMVKMLTELRDGLHGHPATSGPDGYPTEDSMTFEGWSGIITEMIAGFEAAILMEDYPDTDEYDQLEQTFHNGMKLFTEHYRSLWD